LSFLPHLLLAVLEGTVAAAVLALSALGLSLVFGVMRVVNVAHGEFFMLGAMLAWWTAKMMPGGPFAGFIAALIVAPGCCWRIGLPDRAAPAPPYQL
jgi:branched-chain amino acid transport system permease protein